MNLAGSLVTKNQPILQKIPPGWKYSLVKYLGRYINGYAFKPEDWSDEGKPILRIQNLSNPNASFNRYQGSLPEAYIVRNGDILISWSASLGVFQWTGEDSWLNQHIFKVDVNRNLVRPEYFRWLASWFIFEMAHKAHGSTMQHLTWDAFGSFPVLLPSLKEQCKIANYLDYETAKIDKLISAKERLLELLAEKRHVIINDAVTHGLNKNPALKKVDIPWLDRIPEHWRAERGRYIFIQSSLPVQENDEIVTCFRDGQVTLRRNRREEGFTNAIQELGYQGIRSGQLVLHSMDAFAGAIGVSDSDGKCSPEYIICNPANGSVFNPYYAHLLRVMALQGFVQASCPAVRERAPRIRFSDLADMLLPVPPVNEQKEICVHIATKTGIIDNLKNVAFKTIQLLQERRTALITAAVTGQIKVTA